MINRRYDNTEWLLIKGAYETLNKTGEDLNLDNYSYFFKKVLSSIILENNYTYITRTNNARDNLIGFIGYDTYFNIIKYKIGDDLFKKLMPSLYLDNAPREQIRKEFSLCIEYYVDNILLNNITDNLLKRKQREVNTEQIEAGISDVKYYPPSNSCREAIMSGKQIRVSHSEEKIAGMQAVSDVGKVRKNQEDSYYIGQHPQNKDFKIMLVADGMGGCNLGEKASNLAARELLTWFESLDSNMYYQSDNSELEKKVKDEINKINNDIVNKYPGAGTTLCFSIVKNDNIYMCNIGDSKGFVVSNNKIIYETKTHNLAEMFYKVPADFARFHPESNVIVYSLGMERINVGACILSDTIPMDKNSEYQVILCSDGVSDCLSREQIWAIASKSSNVANDLVNAALNSKSSFRQELDKSKRQFGIMGRYNFKKLLEILKDSNMDINYDNVIMGGKDNTTVVSGTIRR